MNDVLFFPKVRRPADVNRSKRRRGKYSYPTALLFQDYFCRNGRGEILPPSLSPGMLLDEHWSSPLQDMLTRMQSDGHDVAACQAEFEAMRRGLALYQRQFKELKEALSKVERYHQALDVQGRLA